MAAAFGIRSESPKTLNDVKDAFGRALDESRPTLLHLEIDGREYDDLV
jgi:thiamine pyrophosphate-dependent acetolactate synthase large subunit-like protein